jgi:hypothetical protein
VLRSGTLFSLTLGIVAALALGALHHPWFQANDLPDGFQNEFVHLFTLTEIWFRGRDEGIAAAWPALWDEYYPPGIHAVGSFALALFGPGREVATQSQLLFLLLLVAAAARLTFELGGRGPAFVVAVALTSSPAIFGNVRRYEPNVAVAACAALVMARLVLLPRIGTRWQSLLLGFLLAMGLLVDRLSVGLYVGVPLLLVLASDLRASRSSVEPGRWRRWGLVALTTALLAGPYYLRFFDLHWEEVRSQLHGEITARGIETGAAPFLSAQGALFYPLSIFDCQLGPLYTLAATLGLLGWVRARRDLPADRRRILEAAVIVPLVVLSLLGKKQPYYSIPVLAPLLVIAVLGLRALLPGRRPVLVGLFVLVAMHQVLFLTRGRGLIPAPGRWAWFAGQPPLPKDALGETYVQAAPPFHQGLQIERIARLCRSVEGERRSVVLYSEGQAAYEGQLMPTLRLALDRREVEGLVMGPPAVLDHWARSGCFIFVDRDGAPWPTPLGIERTLEAFDQSPADPALLALIADAQSRARLLDGWTTSQQEHVRVFALP